MGAGDTGIGLMLKAGYTRQFGDDRSQRSNNDFDVGLSVGNVIRVGSFPLPISQLHKSFIGHLLRIILILILKIREQS